MASNRIDAQDPRWAQAAMCLHQAGYHDLGEFIDGQVEEADTQRHNPAVSKLIAICRQHGDFVAGDDGFWLFWPTRNNGALTDWMCRAIADELDRLNVPVQEEWERRIALLEQPE